MTDRSVTGVGIGLRREHFDAILETDRRVDWLEIVPENFMAGGRAPRVLERVRERWSVAAHGVALNVGGPIPLRDDYLSSLDRLLTDFELGLFTEHLCYSTSGRRNFADLLPLPFTEEAVHWVADRVKRVQDRLGRRILLENISYYAEMPAAEMTEGEFVTAVLEEADAGLLLDVNNVFVNAHNFSLDPQAALQSLPLDRVGQMHLAGHKVRGDLLVDDHGSAVPDPVFALYETVLAHTGPVPVLVEWDTNIPTLERVLDEADKARGPWLAAKEAA